MKASDAKFEEITPDKNANWINLTENNWEDLIPVADKKTKASKVSGQDRSIFKMFSMGVVTNRDEWAYSHSNADLSKKMNFLFARYEGQRRRKVSGVPVADEALDASIKWTRHLKSLVRRNIALSFDQSQIRKSYYRPFVMRELYFDSSVNEFQYQTPAIWPTPDHDTKAINFNVGGRLDFAAFASSCVPSLTVLSLDGNQSLPICRYTSSGEKLDNITDWALNKFAAHYKPLKITKDDIFAYVYAVLHDPIYRETYAQNLKREFPRIPFYPNFTQWRDWGQRLLDLHIGYEAVTPWPLTRKDVEDTRAKTAGLTPKAALKADKAAGTITMDSETTLSGIPPECWDYKLGNRSGLEWVLDQYREKTPKDPTIREKFNTYRFADYKEHVADLLARVTRVSVETMEVIEAMKAAKRSDA